MEELIFGGKKYISSRRAARIAGYTKDYIGQLSRSGKIGARLVGRNWYIDEESLLDHRKQSNKASETEEAGQEYTAREEREDVSVMNKPKSAFSQPIELIYHGSEDLPLNPELKSINKEEKIEEPEEYNVPIKKEKLVESVSLPHQELEIEEKDEIEPSSVVNEDYRGFLKNSVAATFILLGGLTSLSTVIVEQVLYYDSELLEEVSFVEEIDINKYYRVHLSNVLELNKVSVDLPVLE